MPNLASISAFPTHSPVAPKEKERASGKSGKEDGANSEFEELVRKQAGPLQSLSRAKLRASVTDDPSELAASSVRETAGFQSPVEDQCQSTSSLNQPDVTYIAGVKTAMAGSHVNTPKLLLIELGGKGKPAVAAANVKDDIPLPKQARAVESGKSKDMLHSDSVKALEKNGKKIDSNNGGKKTSEIAGSPVAVQVLNPMLVPFSPAPLAPERIAPVYQSQGATEIPGSAQEAGGKADWLRAKGLGQPAATSPVELGINPASADNPDPEFDISGSSGVGAAKPPNDAAPIKAVAPPSAQVRHVDSEKLLSAASATLAPLGTTAVHGSDGAPVYGPQHQVSSSAPSAAGPAASSSVAATPNVYDRIDQGVAPVLLHSGVQHVSVGVHDPDLGWVEIQTQSAAGHVDATLLTSSGQTHASLAAQLPAMAQYLEQRDVRVGTLVVHHHAMGGGSGAGNGGSGYGSANTGAGAHHSNQRDSGGERASQLSVPGHHRSSSATTTGARLGEEGAALRSISYINVRA